MLGEHIVTRSEVTRAIVSGYSPWCGVPAPPSASRTADLPLVYATKCRLSPPAPPAVHDLTTQSPAHPQPHHPTRRPPPAAHPAAPQQMSTQHKGGLAEPLVSSAGTPRFESAAAPASPKSSTVGPIGSGGLRAAASQQVISADWQRAAVGCLRAPEDGLRLKSVT